MSHRKVIKIFVNKSQLCKPYDLFQEVHFCIIGYCFPTTFSFFFFRLFCNNAYYQMLLVLLIFSSPARTCLNDRIKGYLISTYIARWLLLDHCISTVSHFQVVECCATARSDWYYCLAFSCCNKVSYSRYIGYVNIEYGRPIISMVFVCDGCLLPSGETSACPLSYNKKNKIIP